MASAWANLKVGDPILDTSHFDVGFRPDFTQPLDGGLHANGILGTSNGYLPGQPNKFTYPTDGQFKVGGHLQFHQTYATGYQYPWASDQRNKEPQHHVHFWGNQDPVTYGPINPDPMSFFEVRDGVFIMKSRRVTEAEKAWCRVKGYATMENGKEATYDWFNANGGVPADWAPTSLLGPQKTDSDGQLMFDQSGQPVRDGDALVFFLNMPADFACTTVSTYNRASLSFGRSQAEVMLPNGAMANGPTTNLRNIITWFCAFWDLEDVPARCDINGRLHDKDTYTPGNPGAGDVLNELDQLELFGADALAHVTTHHYLDGYAVTSDGVTKPGRIQRNHGQSNSTWGDILITVQAAKGGWITPGVDRFPPMDGQPGLIAYHLNGKYVALYEMPDYLGQPKILYEPREDQPYRPKLNDNYTVKRLGSQLYENGLPAYTHWCQIFTTAMSAPFTKSLAVAALNNGTALQFDEPEEFKIKWSKMDPLKAQFGNPDSRPLINYRNGEFGGSGSGVGPVYAAFSTGHNNSGTVNYGNTGSVGGGNTGSGGGVSNPLIGTAVGNHGIRVNGNQIYMPNSDWYQIQDAVTYKSVFEGAGTLGPVTVPAGKYQVINLTFNTRTENVVLPAAIIDNTGGGTGTGTDGGGFGTDTGTDPLEMYPDNAKNLFTTYQVVAKRPNGGKVLIPAGRYGK